MKILIKSVQLFLFGIYVELYKKHLDFTLNRYFKVNDNLSGEYLAKKSNRSYRLYRKFKEYENKLKFEILIKNIIEHTA